MAGSRDVNVVNAAIAGDRAAYANLARKYAGRVYAVCLSILQNRDDSQDIAQDVFLTGMRKIHTLRDASQFTLWITRMAENRCRDHRRNQRRRNELLHERRIELPQQSVTEGPDLSDALSKLPEKFRTPLLLYYFDGQSSENVARALDMRRAGASTRLARARQALRQILEKNHE